jgi:phosphoglycerate dehydrogenase-like enzyme
MKNQNKLLILTRQQKTFLQKTQSLNLPDLEIFAPETHAEIEAILPEVNLILANPFVAKNYVNQASNLKWLQSTFAGIDALVSPNLRQDYLLTNVKDAYGRIMAEYVLSYILFFEKRTIENLTAQKNKLWDHRYYQTIEGKVLGILGTGSIGSEIARFGKFFGLETLGLNTSGTARSNFDYVFDSNNLTTFLAKADYIVSVLPSTSSTRGLVNKKFLSQMKTTSVFMNIGRGDTVIEADIIEALETKKIKAAVLDVFNQEPLPTENPIWNCDNLYLTPHVSGKYISNIVFKILSENYFNFMQNLPLKYLIDFKKGY